MMSDFISAYAIDQANQLAQYNKTVVIDHAALAADLISKIETLKNDKYLMATEIIYLKNRVECLEKCIENIVFKGHENERDTTISRAY